MQKAIHGITVAHFLDTYRAKLKMELVNGEAGLHRLIREGSINRPASNRLTGRVYSILRGLRFQSLRSSRLES